MKLSDEEFKALQKHWYGKAKESGFKDIELEIKRDLSCFYRNNTALDIITKQEYYALIIQKVEDPDTYYKNAIHRYIMLRHSEGARVKDIVNELRALGQDRHRHSVRFIIRNYEMQWKIRYYTKKQLNKK